MISWFNTLDPLSTDENTTNKIIFASLLPTYYTYLRYFLRPLWKNSGWRRIHRPEHNKRIFASLLYLPIIYLRYFICPLWNLWPEKYLMLGFSREYSQLIRGLSYWILTNQEATFWLNRWFKARIFLVFRG